MPELLHTPACDLLQCRFPVVLAGMGGVSRSELVSAVTRAGGFGILGMVREPTELIAREVAAVRAEGHARFGVNLIPAATERGLLERQIATCLELEVPVVSLFWDIDAGVVRRFRDAGTIVVYQVGSVEEGRAARDAGAHILVAQGREAGGHVRGSVPLSELLPALAQAVDIPVLAAGGLSSGRDLVDALALGGQGIVMGTAMIATPESFAHDYHKERLLDASANDTILTRSFHVNWPPGAPVRVLDAPVVHETDEGQRAVVGWDDGRPIYKFSTDSPLRSTTGRLDAMALYAGMGVGAITKMAGAGQRVARVLQEAEALLAAGRPQPARKSPDRPALDLMME